MHASYEVVDKGDNVTTVKCSFRIVSTLMILVSAESDVKVYTHSVATRLLRGTEGALLAADSKA